MRTQLFRGIRPILLSLHAFRAWSSGALLQADSAGEMNLYTREKLSVANAEIEALKGENNRLRLALGFKEKNKVNMKGASIVYYGREFGKEYILIDRGTDEDMQKGDMVINANGLFVGTIKDIEGSFAKVGIAANKEEVFDVEILPLGVKAFAKGLGGRVFSLELVAQNVAVRKGDYIMTKGGQLSFLLGEVVRVETEGVGIFKEIRGVLLAHPDLEKEVFVVGR